MKTVIHVSSPNSGDQQHAMVNTLNMLNDESVYRPGDDVVIVANGAGVRMLIEETTPNREMVEELQKRAVTLLVCQNALRGMGVSDDELLPGVEGVPSGSGALARLQDEGYGYIKAP